MNDETKSYIDSAIREHLHDGNLSQRVNLFDVFGSFRTVGAAPTNADVPQDAYGQVRLVVDSLVTPTTAELYVYSFEIRKWTHVALTIL